MSFHSHVVKKLCSTVLLIVIAICLIDTNSAQSPPQAISWQTVVRLPDGSLVQNQLVSVRFDLHQGSANGTVVYSETHADTTDEFGLLNLALGAGTAVSGQFDTIDWGNGPYFTEVLVDPAGGSNYLSTGAQQMMSVPYALYAGAVTGLPLDGEVGETLNWCPNGPTWGPCPTCDDGIQNGDEVGVDCGGSSCQNCADRCSDGVQNGDETGIDCGGNSCYPCFISCGQDLTDPRDGHVYSTVQIQGPFGTQCWMAENLNYGTMVNSINTGSSHTDQSDNGIAEKYCYGNTGANCNVYGGLYEWNELMEYETSSTLNPSGIQGLCPPGWHIPSDSEWKQLEMNLGMSQVDADQIGFRGTDEGGKMKDVSTGLWNGPNAGATNSSGFTALPGGSRVVSGAFTSLNNFSRFWSASESSFSETHQRKLGHNNSNVARGPEAKEHGFSCRCLKD